MNFYDYFGVVNRRQREIHFARACMVRLVPCSIRPICFTCLTDIDVKWTKTLQNVVKKSRFLHFSFLVCQEYPIIYANGRLACLMLACRQYTLQGMLGVLVERYEIFAYDFEWQEAPTTYHVVDVRVLQRVVKTAISWTRIWAIYSKLPLLLLLTHLAFIITESVRKLFVTVYGRTVYMHSVLTSDAVYRNVIVKIVLIRHVYTLVGYGDAGIP